MKKAIAVGLVTTLAVTGLVMSALAQQPAPAQNNPAGSSFYPTQGGQNSALATYGSWLGQTQPSGEIDKLARQLAKAKGEGERETAKAKLNDLLDKQFEERQKKHQAESEALEAQVKKLKELIQTRSENRKEIISRRLEQIVREAQGLGW
jgi:hypothetical protein